MKRLHTSGFTIIETMLFLGITGVLVLMIVGGVGASINIQRYRDSVETLKMTLQDQYAQVSNVQNSRDANQVCNASAQPTLDTSPGDKLAPGQTNCMIVGRFLRITGSNMTVHQVYAYENERPPRDDDDIAALRGSYYTYNVGAQPAVQKTLEWQTSIAWPQSGAQGPEVVAATNPRTISILFIKSPHRGGVFTFSSNGTGDPSNAFIRSMISATIASVPGRGERILCVQSNGLFVSADRSIYIQQNATGPSAIEVSDNGVLPGGARC